MLQFVRRLIKGVYGISIFKKGGSLKNHFSLLPFEKLTPRRSLDGLSVLWLFRDPYLEDSLRFEPVGRDHQNVEDNKSPPT